MSRRETIAVAVGMLVLSLSPTLTRGQSAAANSGRTAGEAYKNVQVLKDMPAEQLPAAMQLVAASLGVRCSYCHVEGANEKDDKKEKQTARSMMQMVLAINQNNFNGRATISCHTCHRGSPSPVGTPVIPEGEPPARLAEPAAAPAGLPSAEVLLDKFVSFMGGTEALSKIATRAAGGTATAADGQRTPVEVFSKGSERRVLILHTAEGDRSTGYNGDSGWTTNNAGAPREMSAADLEGTRLEDDLYLAAHIKQAYTQWRVGRPEKIFGRDAYVLSGSAPGRVPVRLYLDQQTGELLRLIRYTETPLGRLPAAVDYADYRQQDGIRVPYRVTLARTNSRTVIQWDSVRQNVPVEEDRFARPAAPGRP